MRIHTDRFETVLPKGRFFTPPTQPPKPPKPPQKDSNRLIWAALAVGAIVGFSLPVITSQGTKPAATVAPGYPPMPLDPTPIPTPAPASRPIPVHRLPVPTPAQPLDAPRAPLVHVRPVGSVMNVVMPDGRVLNTRYMGELPSPANLPRTGGQPGDEWYTRSDNHCWVLGTLPGSVTTGWIDP
jgi:hypothetical protein